MNELTIITHTRLNNPYPELLERCKQSVDAALIPGAQHLVLVNDLPGLVGDGNQWVEFAHLRYSALQYSKYIAFVDDDDYIHSDSLKLCMDALLSSGAGVAVTNEVVVNVDGKQLSANRLPRAYCGVSMHPRTIHHLTIMKSELVSPVALDLALQFGVGIEWAMKASACLHGGGVHIPIDGAYWTQHTNRPSIMNNERRAYDEKILPMGNAIKKAFPVRQGLLPTVSIRYDHSTAVMETLNDIKH